MDAKVESAAAADSGVPEAGRVDTGREIVPSPLSLEEVFALYAILKPYGAAFLQKSNLDVLATLFSAVTDRDPQDVMRTLSILTRKPAEQLTHEIDGPIDFASAVGSAFIEQNISELVGYGIQLGLIDA